MAITYPRDFPSPAYIATTNTRPVYQQAASVVAGGHNYGSDLGDPLWMSDIASVRNVPIEGMKAWRAWHKSLRGVLKTFFVTDPDYSTPAAFPSGSGWGTPVVGSFDQAAGTIDVTGFSPDAEITAGDRFHIVYASSSHYAYHEVTEDATATGGGAATLTVEGPILDGIAASDALVFLNPKYEAMMLPNSWAAPDTVRGTGSVKFSALQVPRVT